MTGVRMVASDLDGTFLAPGGVVSAENARAVAAARQGGVKVVFATGRPARSALPLLSDIGADAVVCSNGALALDPRTHEPIIVHSMEPAVASSVFEHLTSRVPGSGFAVEGVDRSGCDDVFSIGDVPASSLVHVPSELVHAHGVVKLLIQHREMTSDELCTLVSPLVGDALTCTVSLPGPPGLVEMSAPGVSKRTALEELADGFGIRPAQVAAFGDMPNDAEMLGWAGLPHVMPASHPTLLTAGHPVLDEPQDTAVGRAVLDLLITR